MTARARLAARLVEALAAAGAPEPGARLVVAVSGGRDSTALLHLLRFAPELPRFGLVAAHLDHAMRPGSDADADWVRGLCAAWGVPCRTRRLPVAPADEAEARRARYAFLEEVRADEGAARVLTAHHADDQAETVLFRAARGAGIRGLRGILPAREPALWRPLLETSADEIAAYAGAVGLRWREDPTNRQPRPRNVLRHEILPRLEAAVAPGAAGALARLARLAREEEAAWESLLPGLLDPLDVRTERDGVSWARAPLLEHHPAVQARLLRALARRAGTALTDAGTRSVVTFSRAGSSGGGVDLPGGVTFRRELDRLAFRRGAEPDEDRPLTLAAAEAGSGEAVLAGRRWRLSWGPGGAGAPEGDESARAATFAVAALRFPLTVRGRAPGDRMAFPYGEKKLKKVLLEARIPAPLRDGRPVLVDAEGRVLWLPGIARSTLARGADGDTLLHIECTDVDND